MIRKPAVSHCQTEFTCHTQGKETYGCCLPLSSSEIKQKALSEVVDTEVSCARTADACAVWVPRPMRIVVQTACLTLQLVCSIRSSCGMANGGEVTRLISLVGLCLGLGTQVPDGTKPLLLGSAQKTASSSAYFTTHLALCRLVAICTN